MIDDKQTDLWNEIGRLYERICERHSVAGGSVMPATAAAEERVLALIDNVIAAGDVGAYVIKAHLASCNNWHTGIIVRMSQFRQILLEGIDCGALAPDDDAGWEWLYAASECNDPGDFMTDMDRYYDLLATAAEEGNENALDIMNMIWPPEQIIEED